MGEKKTKKIERIIKNRQFLDNFTEGKWCELINVSDLITIKDNPNEFRNVLGENEVGNPGCYKWWAEKDDIEKLLSKKLSVDKKLKKLFSENEFSDFFEKKDGNLYCIYVGKANYLYDRLRNHSKNTEQSTLRRTICSLTCNHNDSLEKINDTIDEWLNKFKLQYFPLVESKRIEEKRKRKRGEGETTFYKLNDAEHDLSLLDLEYFLINEKFHILNVEENHFVDYTKKKGNQLNKETVRFIKEEILAPLKNEKKEWPKEIIDEMKKKSR